MHPSVALCFVSTVLLVSWTVVGYRSAALSSSESFVLPVHSITTRPRRATHQHLLISSVVVCASPLYHLVSPHHAKGFASSPQIHIIPPSPRHSIVKHTALFVHHSCFLLLGTVVNLHSTAYSVAFRDSSDINICHFSLYLSFRGVVLEYGQELSHLVFCVVGFSKRSVSGVCRVNVSFFIRSVEISKIEIKRFQDDVGPNRSGRASVFLLVSQFIPNGEQSGERWMKRYLPLGLVLRARTRAFRTSARIIVIRVTAPTDGRTVGGRGLFCAQKKVLG